MEPVEARPAPSRREPRLWIRLLILLLGLALGQAILFGPSLIGKRLLLPLELLGTPSAYLPEAQSKDLPVGNIDQGDLIEYQEPERIFAAQEFAAGRFPLWDPHRFGGAPIYMMSFSPLWLPGYFIRSPVVLAWIQFFTALTAGIGMYLFVRRVVKVSFWPAAIAAWCFPMTGSFISWEGWYLPAVMCFLPWMLAAVDAAIRRPGGLGGPCVALITTIMLVSGAQDIAGQILLAAGIFAAWCFFDHYGFRRWNLRRFAALAVIAAAWGAGIAGSAWIMLPFHEYVQTGLRMQDRSAGTEERPPIGLSALPEAVLPAMYGEPEAHSIRFATTIAGESAVDAYAGLMAALLFAPLALGSRRHRSVNILMMILLFFSLSWILDVPGMVWLLRLPVLNMMSHDRLVLITSLVILSLAAVGLERAIEGNIPRRWWFELPILLLALVGGWCVYRVNVLPREVTTELQALLNAGNQLLNVKNATDMARVQSWFRVHFAVAGSLALLSLGGWYCLRWRGRLPVWAVAVAGLLMCGDMIYFAYDRSDQADPALYYPPLGVVEQIKKQAPGRIMGFSCFYPNFAQAVGLDDIRGYDGVEPARMVQLVTAASLPPSVKLHSAATLFMAPVIRISHGGSVQLSPILSMLGVRYVLFRIVLPDAIKADFKDDDYSLMINRDAMPRAFVPERVEAIADGKERLARLSSEDFNPAKVAYVEAPLDVPAAASGAATITTDLPAHVAVSADMRTPGLLVLADNWDAGWKATVNGREQPILRVNHAVRGVVLPAGKSAVEFTFAPASLRLGTWISAATGLLLAGWVLAVLLARRVTRSSARRFVTIAGHESQTHDAPLVRQ